MSDRQSALGERWLLLVHRLPAQPAYLRVKLWRRLLALGAVPVKNGVHVLPSKAETLEDFEWLRKEVIAGGGEATIVEGRLVDGLGDQDLHDAFNKARAAEYRELEADASALLASKGKRAKRPSETAGRLQARLDAISSIDFFKSEARQDAEAAVLAAIRAHEGAKDVELDKRDREGAFNGKVWVTRSGVYVDRIASAWFIKRFVDPRAALKFVPTREYGARDGEVRFDMFEAEFTHVGDACTMEVLARHFRPDDQAARAMAEIVHDIDLKDSKFARAEAGGIRTLISGICARTDDDEERVERGRNVFDDLYAFFEQPAK